MNHSCSLELYELECNSRLVFQQTTGIGIIGHMLYIDDIQCSNHTVDVKKHILSSSFLNSMNLYLFSLASLNFAASSYLLMIVPFTLELCSFNDKLHGHCSYKRQAQFSHMFSWVQFFTVSPACFRVDFMVEEQEERQ